MMTHYKIQKPVKLRSNPVEEWLFYEENGYCFADIFSMVPLKDIDFEKWNQGRYDSALKAIKEEIPLPPVQLYFNEETRRYTVTDGNHRIAASIDMGMTHIPAIVSKKFNHPIHAKPSTSALKYGKLAEEALYFKTNLQSYFWQNELNIELLFDKVQGNQYIYLVSTPGFWEEQPLVITAIDSSRNAKLSWQGKNLDITGTLEQVKIEIYKFLKTFKKESGNKMSLIVKASEMYNTFGAEDYLVKSFIRHYDNIRRAIPVEAERVFTTKHYLYLGAANISNVLKPILEHNGTPVIDKIPNRIKFYLMHPNYKWVKGDMAALFAVTADNSFIMAKVTDDFANPFSNGVETFKLNIDHELQHFLQAIYKDKERSKSYYESDSEIQAYARTIAKDALNIVKVLYNATLEYASPEKAIRLLTKLQSEKNNLMKQYVDLEVKKFFKAAQGKISVETQQKYYRFVFINFSRLFDEWLGAFKY